MPSSLVDDRHQAIRVERAKFRRPGGSKPCPPILLHVIHADLFAGPKHLANIDGRLPAKNSKDTHDLLQSNCVMGIECYVKLQQQTYDGDNKPGYLRLLGKLL